MNYIPYLKSAEDKKVIEFPLQEKNVFEKVLDLMYFGNEHGGDDRASEEDVHAHEIEALEDNFEKAVDIKLESLRLNMRRELKEIQSEIKDDLEENIGKILEKLK